LLPAHGVAVPLPSAPVRILTDSARRTKAPAHRRRSLDTASAGSDNTRSRRGYV